MRRKPEFSYKEKSLRRWQKLQRSKNVKTKATVNLRRQFRRIQGKG